MDDNDYAREFAAEAVKLAGLEPVTFEDPLKAIEALETQHFDLVILDVDMPKMDGMEVLSHIRKILPNLPVIMATGNKEDVTKMTSFKLGATDYLNKPYSVQDLVNCVKNALDDTEG
ncbi:MAG: response regulator [Planctomycetota bacterium]|nr:response regulator [Planctomycetota bacterium]